MNAKSNKTFLLALVVIFGCGGAVRAAEPSYGSAITVDGDYSDWDLTNDYFATMYRAGDPTKEIESYLYLRYNCTEGKMYVLVLAVDGVPALFQPDDAWVKINGAKVVGGGYACFDWVYEGETLVGWEGCFAISEGSYTIDAHVNVYDDGEGQTSAAYDYPLEITCVFVADPQIDLEKYVSPDGTSWFDADVPTGPSFVEGADVWFKFAIKNTGNVPLTNILLTDTDYDAELAACAAIPEVLAPGDSYECIITVLAALDDGEDPYQHYNLADVVADYYEGETYIETVSDEDPAHYYVQVPEKAAIGDFVWEDMDHNGIQDDGEPGIEGVKVELWACDGAGNPVTFIGSMTTASDGSYSFMDLDAGSYKLRFFEPQGTGYLFTIANANANASDTVDSDANPWSGWTDCTDLAAGENDPTWDAGMFRFATIGDTVWHDLNADGGQDSGEVGVPGVTVELYDCADNPIASTTTDADGLYSFSVVPGDYKVKFIAPDGFEISPQDAPGVDDALDSDADPTTGEAACTTLVSGEVDNTWDAGVYARASLGDFVWEDVDGDGIQDAGEPGIPHVTVNLYECDEFGATGALLETKVTDASGYYLFDELMPGKSYRVEFVKPEGYEFTLQDQGGDDTVDSDADPTSGRTSCVYLTSGEINRTLDAGLYIPASLGDSVWEDMNGDGIQDDGEPGIEGVTVNLYACGSTTVLATDTTDIDGKYLFDDLAPGSYFVEFIAPEGYEFTPQDQGADDTVDSDADPTTGKTICTTLISDEDDLTWDAGLYRPASLGDYVWADTNYNGIQDDGDSGIEGVKVTLYSCDDTKVAETTTDAAGLYAFTDLKPGSYYVVFEEPADYVFALKDQGADDTVDSDADPTTGKTICTDLISNEDDLTWDAGLVPTGSISGAKFYDTNLNGTWDDGEPPIPGWTVYLTGTDFRGSAWNVTAATGADGSFVFDDLPPGDYTVKEEIPLEGWVPTTSDSFTKEPLNADEDYVGPDFGNVQIGCWGGGHTPGFWSNDNGYAKIVEMGLEGTLAALSGLPLVNADGTAFDPLTYDEFAAWLLASDASENMAYKLSVHYASMWLNVQAGFVQGSDLVYAPDVPGVPFPGFTTVDYVLTGARNALATDNLTPPDDPNREIQEVIKDALDGANNNENFLCGPTEEPGGEPEEEEFEDD